jgi:hypothetical protein
VEYQHIHEVTIHIHLHLHINIHVHTHLQTYTFIGLVNFRSCKIVEQFKSQKIGIMSFRQKSFHLQPFCLRLFNQQPVKMEAFHFIYSHCVYYTIKGTLTHINLLSHLYLHHTRIHAYTHC